MVHKALGLVQEFIQELDALRLLDDKVLSFHDAWGKVLDDLLPGSTPFVRVLLESVDN
jgi:hypothetical protein